MNYPKTIAVCISLIGLSLLLYACSDKSTNPTPVPGVYKIAYSLDIGDSERNNIFTIDPDGTDIVQLTFASLTSSNSSATWSPDGQYIYYKDFMDETNEIIRMNADDGTHKVNLTNYAGLDRLCDISPDGTKMAFISTRDNTNYNIYVMDLDSMTATNITSGESFESRQVKFTPDGQQLLYSTYNGTNYDLCLETIDGSIKSVLSNLTYDDTYGTVSPNGQKIAYVSILDGTQQYEVWVCSITGTDRTKISTSTNDNLEPFWSPNSQKIAYTEMINYDTANIIVVNADGSDPVYLTDSSSFKYSPKWSPDGTKIAYISKVGTTSALYIMNSDGSEIIQLINTFGTGYVHELAWSPGL
ncbi:MAG: PD40 domain-containing protein [candidate division Zixibacteria bacterium]|nr:PD40 domain-containing protein [candidate division Zixibacteria bacterium]